LAFPDRLRAGAEFCVLMQGQFELTSTQNSTLVLQVGARLISHAGSLINLAKQPASTVQILGAEKALFRCVCA